MKTLTKALWIGILAVLLVSRTITLQFHPSNLTNIFSWGTNLFGSQSQVSSYRAKATELKREGELKIFTDSNRRMDLSIAYAQADIDYLKETLQAGGDNEQLIAQGAQVLKSLHRVEGYAKDVKVERLADIRPLLKEMFAATQDVFADIHANHTEITYLIDELKAIIENVEQYLGRFDVPQPEVKESTEDKPESTTTPGLSIPLKF